MRDFLKIISFIVAVLFAGIYVINYEATGDLEFTTQSTKIYSTPDEKDIILTLKPGETIYSLTYYNDDGMDKIRYTDPNTDKKIVGFVEEKYVCSYHFPDESVGSFSDPIILSVSKDTSLRTFINTFSSLLNDDNALFGVYVETNADDQSGITDFCEEQHIPYGYISELDDTTYEIYASNELYSTAKYNVLPQAFKIKSLNNTVKKYDLANCILSVADSSTADNSYNYWTTISSSSRDASIFANNPSVVAYKYKSDSTEFGYSYISDEFEAQINRAYD